MNKESILKLLEDAQLRADHLPNTRQTYERVIASYIDLVSMGTVLDFQGYLDHLAVNGAPSSVRLALNAGVFFCSEVLMRERPVFKVPKCRKRTRVPVFLTHSECMAVLEEMDTGTRMRCALMYGSGLRPSELFHLRLKDVDFQSGMLIIRGGKGDKDRTVRLPDALVPILAEQVRRCRRQWQRDHAKGIYCPVELPSLQKKLGRKLLGTLAWYYLFPSRVVRGDERWYATNRGFSENLKAAVESAGIVKWVTPRTFRHSYATNLLHMGVDIRTLQTQLGHEDVKTTEIYAHAIGDRGTASPLDRKDVPGNVISPAWRDRTA